MTQAGERRVLVEPLVTGRVVKVGGDKVNYHTPFDRSGGDAAARSARAEGQSVDCASVASALGSTQSYCYTPSVTSHVVVETDRESVAGFGGVRGQCCGRRRR